MGVDVGKKLHVIIAERSTRNTLKVVKIGQYDSFTDLHDLARDFNVKSIVIDLYLEQRKVRELQRQETMSVFGCQYVEQRTQMWQWDDRQLILKVNRTEICDATHELVVEPGRLILPRRNSEIEQFAKECCNIAKVLDEDTDTGSRVYRYKKLGSSRPDHYRHALNYCLLASERCGIISDQNLISRFFSGRAKRTWMTS
jgi:hypothetical protein